jgi:hypothetical protein
MAMQVPFRKALLPEFDDFRATVRVASAEEYIELATFSSSDTAAQV